MITRVSPSEIKPKYVTGNEIWYSLLAQNIYCEILKKACPEKLVGSVVTIFLAVYAYFTWKSLYSHYLENFDGCKKVNGIECVDCLALE